MSILSELKEHFEKKKEISEALKGNKFYEKVLGKKVVENKWANYSAAYAKSLINPLDQIEFYTNFSKEMRKLTGNEEYEVDKKFEKWSDMQDKIGDGKDQAELAVEFIKDYNNRSGFDPNHWTSKALDAYDKLPKGVKKTVPIASTAVDVSDYLLKANEIVYAEGEEKYTKLGEHVFSTLGGFAGDALGAYVGRGNPAVTAAVSLTVGKKLEDFGGEVGFWTGKGVYFVKSNLGKWTKSANNFVDKTADKYILPSVDMQSGWIQKGSHISNYLHRGAINWSANKAKQLVSGVGSSIQNGAGSVGNQLSKMLPSPASRDMIQYMTNSFQRGVMAKSVAATNKIDETRLLANQLNDRVNTNFKDSVRSATPYVKDFIKYQKDRFKGQVTIGSNLLQGTLDIPEQFLTPDTIEEGFKSALPLGPLSMQGWLNKKLVNHYKKYFKDNPPYQLPKPKSSSSKSYSTSKKHTTTARNAVKNTPQYNNSTNVNMPTGGIQVTVGEPVNFQELAFQVGTRFVTEYKRAMENNKTARA
ncbi:hypothetical protein D3C74_118210 [compost metagenome]